MSTRVYSPIYASTTYASNGRIPIWLCTSSDTDTRSWTELRANTADPIIIPNLDDPKKKEKIRKESLEQSESNEAQRKLELIEEHLKAMEGSDVYGLVDAYKISRVPDLVLSPKFKVPTFDKYDGTKCPSAHLYMYCRKMMGYTSNDKLLIHCFQDSLTGSATR